MHALRRPYEIMKNIRTPRDLPLAKSRFGWLSILLIMSIVVSALSVKMLTKHNSAVKSLRKASPSGVSVNIDYNDAKIGGIVVFVAANIATMIASNPMLFLLQDTFHIIPRSLTEKYPILSKRLSNITFAQQFFGLVISFFVFLGTEGYMCSIVFKRSAKLVVHPNTSGLDQSSAEMMVENAMNTLGIVLSYRHTSYISIVPKVAPAAIFFISPSALVTLRAWYLYRRHSRSALASDTRDEEEETSNIAAPAVHGTSVEKESLGSGSFDVTAPVAAKV